MYIWWGRGWFMEKAKSESQKGKNEDLRYWSEGRDCLEHGLLFVTCLWPSRGLKNGWTEAQQTRKEEVKTAGILQLCLQYSYCGTQKIIIANTYAHHNSQPKEDSSPKLYWEHLPSLTPAVFSPLKILASWGTPDWNWFRNRSHIILTDT